MKPEALMNKRFVAIGLCLAMILSTFNAMAQGAAQASQSWDVLRQLPIGQELQVERKGGKKSSGTLVSSSDTEVVLARKSKTESFDRNDVRQIWTIAPPSRTKKAIYGGIGAIGGFLVGVPIAVSLGFKQCGGSCADEGAGVFGALIGLPVAGALAGRALARGKRTLIYVAP
jgi:hypothetical protein